jgi:hypothetical protein
MGAHSSPQVVSHDKGGPGVISFVISFQLLNVHRSRFKWSKSRSKIPEDESNFYYCIRRLFFINE